MTSNNEKIDFLTKFWVKTYVYCIIKRNMNFEWKKIINLQFYEKCVGKINFWHKIWIPHKILVLKIPICGKIAYHKLWNRWCSKNRTSTITLECYMAAGWNFKSTFLIINRWHWEKKFLKNSQNWPTCPTL